MSQGFFTSVGGILAAQSKIDVIADNIANMNTTGFKESKITFENIYSKTFSSGTAPSSSSGGINPMQVGLGVQVAEVSKNFQSGTIQSTGRSDDLNIQGDGFFSLKDSSGTTLFTRAGNFSLDANGYLVNPNGLQVLGTDSVSSQSGSSTAIYIPPRLKLETAGNANLSSKEIADLNNTSFTEGTFTIAVSYTGGTTPTNVAVNTTGCTTMSDVVTAINNACSTAGFGGVTAAATDGQLVISTDSAGTGNPTGLTFNSGTSNIMTETQIDTATPTTSGTTKSYASKILDYTVEVSPPDSSTSTQSYSSFSVGSDGAIEAVYSNGDKITVKTNGTIRELKYTTSTGVTINTDNITVNSDAVEAANLQIQMAKVVNSKGLISTGGNAFYTGPNSGDASYGIGNNSGFGSIGSGAIEASNVDLPSQFAEMILSQRVIDANSQTFRAINEVLRRIVMMGQ
jgi:flagellar hook protein FlgE